MRSPKAFTWYSVRVSQVISDLYHYPYRLMVLEDNITVLNIFFIDSKVSTRLTEWIEDPDSNEL
jgi:hypothetical protein